MPPDRWLSAQGEPYDPRPAVQAWRTGETEDAPRELWVKLYHQGDVNTASYAAVGDIVRMMQGQPAADWRAYALVASIEEGRHAADNPPVPLELERDYSGAWDTLLTLALRDLRSIQDDLTVRGALAVVAHAKGQHTLAAIALCTEDERVEMLRG